MNRTTNKLSEIIFKMLFRVARYSANRPRTALSILVLLFYQYMFLQIRRRKSTDKLEIPPFIIYSITKKCNLHCKGCYARVMQSAAGEELTRKQMCSVLKQAEELGVGIIMMAGGEPFSRPDLIELCRKQHRQLFPVFTNGLLLTIDKIKSLPANIIPVLSLEGNQESTDERRGDEVYSQLKTRFRLLSASGKFWGASITVTTQNIMEITSDEFVKKLINHGCKLFFYVEYVPVNENTDHLVLSDEEKVQLVTRTDQFSRCYPSLFVAFPGDEDKWGGCLAAGRGFIHIQADGSVEPCPFAPFSDINLKETTLAKALESEFFVKIRKKHHLLQETKGGCALWENRELVKQILDSDN